MRTDESPAGPRKMPRWVRSSLLPGLLSLALSVAATGQEFPPELSAASPEATDTVVADLESRRAAAEADNSLTDDARRRILDLFTRAVEARRMAASAAAETAVLQSRIAAAPERIAELKQQLDGAVSEVESPTHADLPLEDLTRQAREKQLTLAAARDALTRREEELATLNALGPSLNDDMSRRKRTLRELKDNAAVPPPSDEIPATTAAREAYLASQEARLRAEIARAEVQLANYELLVRLARLERDRAASLVPRLDAEREALVQAADARRVEAAQTARQEARFVEAATLSLPPAVAQIATANAQLREELEGVTLETGRTAERLRVAERQLGELEADRVSMRKQVEVVGSTEAIGRLLRRRLRSLSGVRSEALLERERANEIVRASDRRIDLGERRRDLADLAAEEDAVLAALPEAGSVELPEERLRAETVALIARKRDTVAELHEAYGRYATQLASRDAAERQLAATAASLREFILEELLWIRSLPAFSPSDLAAAPQILSALGSPDSWRLALGDALQGAARRPWVAALGLLALLALLGLRPWARRRLAALGLLTGSVRTDAFHHTVLALLLTILIAAAWPAAIAGAAWLLGATEDPAPFSRIVAGTLFSVAHLLAIFTGVRCVFDHDGLALRHFRWSRQVRESLYRDLRWLLPVSVLCVLAADYGSLEGSLEARLVLVRPAIMVFSAALALFAWRFYGRGSALSEFLRTQATSRLVVRTRSVWFTVLVAVPVATFVAAVAGYGYTAKVVVWLLVVTSSLVFGVAVLRAVILRWFSVTQRQLRFQQTLKQREEARAEREKLQQEGGDAPAAEVGEIEEPEVDYRELGEQARSVVQAAVVFGFLLTLWWLWSDLLPALSVLDRVELPLSRLKLVGGVEQLAAVTVSDLAVAVLVLAATGVLAKNLSGLLGFTVLRRVGDDAGKQYAIVTLCQYALVAAGALYAFSAVGVQWSKLQWLVAALGVGLGFGLQEIVANFVSGIILLIERPVRVGDTVTVGDATGTVSRIQIRATTILDWDLKELVVPNKEFVTGRLLNWSLSTDIVRLVVPVGIAYGSDARKARELLLEAATEHEHVLEEPRPRIAFSRFGDNALELEMRVYLPSMDHWLSVRTELHDAVYEKLNGAGIAIAFPQRDVHMDWSGPLDVRLQHPPTERGQMRQRWRGAGPTPLPSTQRR